EAAEGRKGEGGAGNGSGRASVHDTNLRSVSSEDRRVGRPTILRECPAQFRRSVLRSSSLWARQSAATSDMSARLGAAEIVREAHTSPRVPRPDRPLLTSIICPLGTPFCGDE